MDVKKFTTRMLELRKEHGLTHEQVAQKIKVTRPSVSFWESGKIMPGADHVSALAQLFNVPMDYLVGNIDEF